MNRKVLIISVLCVAFVCLCGTQFFKKDINKHYLGETKKIVKEKVDTETPAKVSASAKELQAPVQKVKITQNVQKNNGSQIKVKKGNLYTEVSNNSIPLSGISEITDLSDNIRKPINFLINSSAGIFLIEKFPNKVFVVSDNQKSIRHGVDFVEISTTSGQQKTSAFGYLDKMKDSNNDNWEYDKLNRPLKHIIYDNDGDVEYIETWNYDESSPIKYELKDKDGKVVSVKKETVNSDSNDLQVDNIIYDKDGNTKIKVSTTYEGADIKCFTYYNADKISESASVFSEYQDGKKVKETVYSSDFKIKNTYTSDYNENGDRTGIKVFDKNNQEIEQITEN